MKEKENRPKPWVAGLLSLGAVGMGQVYNREYSKGFALFFSGAIFAILIGVEKINSAMGEGILIALLIYSIYDAYTAAKTVNRPPNRWPILIVILIGVILSIGAFMASWLNAVGA